VKSIPKLSPLVKRRTTVRMVTKMLKAKDMNLFPMKFILVSEGINLNGNLITHTLKFNQLR
jgi:hypothetical protein